METECTIFINSSTMKNKGTMMDFNVLNVKLLLDKVIIVLLFEYQYIPPLQPIAVNIKYHTTNYHPYDK